MQNLDVTSTTTMTTASDAELASIEGGNFWTEAGAMYLGVVALACPPCAVGFGIAAVAVGVVGLMMD